MNLNARKAAAFAAIAFAGCALASTVTAASALRPGPATKAPAPRRSLAAAELPAAKRPAQRVDKRLDAVAFGARQVLKVRYRVAMEGLEEIRAATVPGRSTLFLASHPGFIDPLILVTHLWPDFQPRPIVAEDVVDMVPGLRKALVAANALIVPRPPKQNEGAPKGDEKEARRALVEQMRYLKAELLAGLKRGDNFVVYPAGQLKQEKREQLGNKSLAYDLLSEIPDQRVVLVQMRGIWGSSLSFAPTGQVPDIGKLAPWATGKVLENGVFFMPKRDVPVRLFEAPESLRQAVGEGKASFNRELERLLNEGNIERLDVPYDLGSGEPGIIPAP